MKFIEIIISTVYIDITAKSSGKIIIELPTNLVDSIDTFGRESSSYLYYGKHLQTVPEIGYSTKWRTFEMDFPRGTKILKCFRQIDALNMIYNKNSND